MAQDRKNGAGKSSRGVSKNGKIISRPVMGSYNFVLLSQKLVKIVREGNGGKSLMLKHQEHQAKR
jgi:hypothetical protein